MLALSHDKSRAWIQRYKVTFDVRKLLQASTIRSMPTGVEPNMPVITRSEATW